MPEIDINALKAKYGDVFAYRTEDGKVAYFKRPDRRILSYASSTSGGDNIKYKEAIATNCFVDGDREILQVDKYFLGLSSTILDLVEIVEGNLEKL